MNGPNKPECYITQGWRGLEGTNTNLLGTFISYKENEIVNMVPCIIFTTFYILCNLSPNKLERYITQGWKRQTL